MTLLLIISTALSVGKVTPQGLGRNYQALRNCSVTVLTARYGRPDESKEVDGWQWLVFKDKHQRDCVLRFYVRPDGTVGGARAEGSDCF